MKLRDLGAGLAAALIGTAVPPGASSPSLAAAHHTTRALKAWAPYLTPNEVGAAWALIQAGLSFKDGTGIVLISTWAGALGRSPRQTRRYAARFRRYGVLVSEPRFRTDHRPLGDVNRANWWSLPIPAFAQPVTEDLEAFLEATQGEEGVPEDEQPPAAPARPPPRASRPAPSGPRVAPTLTADEQAVLDALQGLSPLASIANAEAAQRLWTVAAEAAKGRAAVLQALAESSRKAAGATGARLERFVIGCIESVRVQPEPPKNSEEIRKANQERAKRFEQEDARKEAERSARRRAHLARLPPGTGPPAGNDAN